MGVGLMKDVKIYSGGMYAFQYPEGGDGGLVARVVLVNEHNPEFIRGFDITRLGYRCFTLDKIAGYFVKVNEPHPGIKWEG